MSLTKKMAEESRKVSGERGQWIEAYIRVFLESTGQVIEDIELVEQRGSEKDGVLTFSWSLRRKRR